MAIKAHPKGFFTICVNNQRNNRPLKKLERGRDQMWLLINLTEHSSQYFNMDSQKQSPGGVL